MVADTVNEGLSPLHIHCPPLQLLFQFCCITLPSPLSRFVCTFFCKQEGSALLSVPLEKMCVSDAKGNLISQTLFWRVYNTSLVWFCQVPSTHASTRRWASNTSNLTQKSNTTLLMTSVMASLQFFLFPLSLLLLHVSIGS